MDSDDKKRKADSEAGEEETKKAKVDDDDEEKAPKEEEAPAAAEDTKENDEAPENDDNKEDDNEDDEKKEDHDMETNGDKKGDDSDEENINGEKSEEATTTTTESPSPKPKVNAYDNLKYCVVENDGKPDSCVKLIGLKSLFAKQLPKMPRPYIARLVFDRRHKSLAILSDDPQHKGGDEEIIGAICYRGFSEMRFAEIAFCAVNSSHQVKVSLVGIMLAEVI